MSSRLFRQCQEVLQGKNRRATGRVGAALGGGMFVCAYCGQSMSPERIRRKLRGGGVRVHQYYRCANNNRSSEHPPVRWRAEQLEDAVYAELAKLKMDAECAAWFRRALAAASADVAGRQEQQRNVQLKRRGELSNMKDRLLSAHLAGSIDEVTFQSKSTELRTQLGEAEEALRRCGDMDAHRGDRALGLFDWTQQAADVWRGSNPARKREILEEVSLNRMLSDTTLCLEKRKPFDVLAERPSVQPTRGDRRSQ